MEDGEGFHERFPRLESEKRRKAYRHTHGGAARGPSSFIRTLGGTAFAASPTVGSGIGPDLLTLGRWNPHGADSRERTRVPASALAGSCALPSGNRAPTAGGELHPALKTFVVAGEPAGALYQPARSGPVRQMDGSVAAAAHPRRCRACPARLSANRGRNVRGEPRTYGMAGCSSRSLPTLCGVSPAPTPSGRMPSPARALLHAAAAAHLRRCRACPARLSANRGGSVRGKPRTYRATGRSAG